MGYPLTYREFYESLKKGLLLALKCKSCGLLTTPPKICCAECGSTELEVVQLSGMGKIKTFTIIRVAPEGFEPPYIVAMVELDEGPWVMGNLIGLDPDSITTDILDRKVKIGCRVIPPGNYTSGEGVAITFSLI